jgi:Putative zinc-finger
MSAETPHLSDERLLLLVDGELKPRHAVRARRHLSGCARCRVRCERIETSAAEFRRAYQHDGDSRGASAAPLRQALKTQIADIGEQGRTGPSWVVASAMLVAALLGVEFLSTRSGPSLNPAEPRTGARPIPYLTPGATRPVDAVDLCAMRRTAPRVIPARVRQAVVRDYSMELVSAHDYELDYLITPELGGSDDRRNLWPERYSSDLWNAHVKDELERLLPRLVCAGTLPLATAQRDMATDWIAAYKKYFRTDRPLHAFSPFASREIEDDGARDVQPDRPFELPAPRSHGER